MPKNPHEQLTVAVMTDEGPRIFRFDNLLERDAFAAGVMQGLAIAGAEPSMEEVSGQGRTISELLKSKMH